VGGATFLVSEGAERAKSFFERPTFLNLGMQRSAIKFKLKNLQKNPVYVWGKRVQLNLVVTPVPRNSN